MNEKETTTLKDKIEIERVKASAFDDIARGILDAIDSAIVALAGKSKSIYTSSDISKQSDPIGPAQTAADKAYTKIINSLGSKNEILDPNRDSLTDVEVVIPETTIVYKDNSIINQAIDSVMTGYRSVFIKVDTTTSNEVKDTFNTLIQNTPNDEDQTISPVGIYYHIIQGLPLQMKELEDLQLQDLSATGAQQKFDIGPILDFKRIAQSTDFAKRLSVLNQMRADGIAKKIYIIERLRALKASSQMYDEGVTSIYSDFVSDQIGLYTFNRTIDTPGLDPEDWGTTPFNDRLAFGPARVIPTPIAHKVNVDVRNGLQRSYEQLNQKMYVNVIRDRYVNAFDDGQFDYPIARFATNSLGRFGLLMSSASHINIGDYSTAAFTVHHPLKEEYLPSSLGIDQELIMLIGSVRDVNNVDVINQKPIYEREIDGIHIFIDSTGARYVLPPTAPDDSAIMV